MTDRPTVVAVSGSQADDSKTRLALQRALRAAEEAGAETELIDIRAMDLPTFDPDDRDAGDAPQLREAVSAADALLLGTPMYHGSYSSTLKTALDYCRIEDVEGTTVGLLAVAGGGFPLPALEHLHSVCRALKAWTIPHQVVIPNSHSQFEDGQFRDEDLEERVAELGERVVEYAGVKHYAELEEKAEMVAAD